MPYPSGRDDSGSRTWFVVTLMSVMGAGTVMTSTLGVLGPRLVRAFDIGPAVFGWLPATMYASAVLFSGAVGRTVDRRGPGGVATTSIGASMVAVVLFAAALDFWVLFVGMAVAGGVLAASNPATNSLIARRVEPGVRGTLMGVKQAGATLMPVYVGLVMPFVASRVGWRWSALASIPLLVVMLIVARHSVGGPTRREGQGVRSGPAHSQARRDAASVTTAQLAAAWAAPLRVYVAALGFAISVANNFYVLYATERVGVTEATAGAMVAVMGVFSVLARIGWARLGERLPPDVALLTWIGGGAGLATLVVASAEHLGSGAMWVGSVLTGITVFGWNALAMLIVVRFTASQAVGEVSGMVVFPMFMGLAAGPAVFGLVAERAGYSAAWGLQILVTATAVAAAHALYHRVEETSR